MQAQATGVPPPGSRYGTAASAAIVTIGAQYQDHRVPSCILRLALPSPLRRLFDYLPPHGATAGSLQPGMRLRVRPARGHRCAGRAERSERSAAGKAQTGHRAAGQHAAAAALLFKLCLWTAQYYQHSLGDTLSWALPVLLRQGEPAEARLERYWRRRKAPIRTIPDCRALRVSAKP